MKTPPRENFRNGLASAIALLLVAGTSAHATMALNARGHGQVLIYPYYTVNGGYTTLLTVINTTAKGKALKVRFHEGYDGRGVLDMNVYLAPYAVWTSAVAPSILFCPASVPPGECFAVELSTNDSACTVPALNPGLSTPGLGFDPTSFMGANADGGPTTPIREAEGHFDVIEMGEVTDTYQGTLTAITPINGAPPNCTQLIHAWNPGGYWASNSTVDLLPPGGGLYGSENIIDVAQGLLFTANAEAIEDFSSEIQHTAPGQSKPDLDTASRSTDGMVHAVIGSKAIQASFQNPIDAVSALLMTDSVNNEFAVQSSIGAATDWLLTFPTKRFYVDPALTSAAKSPFVGLFGADTTTPGTSCQVVRPSPYDRNGHAYGCSGTCTLPVLPVQTVACYESSVMPIQKSWDSPVSILVSQLVFNNFYTSTTSEIVTASVPGGHVLLDMTAQSPLASNPPCATPILSTSGQAFCGLPVIGFSATTYVNGQVSAGVLANYSGVNPHRTHETCVSSTSGVPCS